MSIHFPDSLRSPVWRRPGLSSATQAAVAEQSPSDFDLAACEALMRGGSKSFFAASKVLPRRVRAPATALYAFCRLADDTIDIHSAEHGGPAGAMAHLRDRLTRIYAGSPMAVDADRALACVVARFKIPQALLESLLEGFQWDMQERRYETLADLQDYAARVAGTVGAMMSIIMGTRDPQALARACELGVAMQLTNIARDVGEDARLGRLYLPRSWMVQAGLDPDAWLRSPVFSSALAGVVARLLRAADALYERAGYGIRALPRDCRAAIQAARLVYAEIGREVERAGFDSVNERAVVSLNRKLALMARATTVVLRVPRGPQESRLEPLPAIAYLVATSVASASATDAATDAATYAASAPIASVPRWSLDERVERTIGLFERIESRQRATHAFHGAGEPRVSVFSG